MFGRRFKGCFGVSCALALLGFSRVGSACLAAPADFSTSPEEVAVDVTPPARPVITSVSTSRNGRDSICRGISFLIITIEPGRDDRTPPEELGYAVRLISGNLVGVRVEPDRQWGEQRISVPFSESGTEHDLDATLELRAIDLAGNESEATEPISVHSDGTAEDGCSIAGSPRVASASAAVGLAALALICRRSRARLSEGRAARGGS